MLLYTDMLPKLKHGGSSLLYQAFYPDYLKKGLYILKGAYCFNTHRHRYCGLTLAPSVVYTLSVPRRECLENIPAWFLLKGIWELTTSILYQK